MLDKNYLKRIKNKFFPFMYRGYKIRPGEDLQGANLNEARLQGADLKDAQLQEAYLVDANLRGADLIDA